MFCYNLYYDFKQLHSFVVLFPSAVTYKTSPECSIYVKPTILLFFYSQQAKKEKPTNQTHFCF